MKKIIVLLTLFFVSHTANSQSQQCSNAWNFARVNAFKIDSLCNLVKQQKIHLRKSKVKICNNNNRTISHKIITKYRSGQSISLHNYRYGADKKIKMITINGKIMSVEVEWLDKASGNLHSTFMRLDDNKWLWTYKRFAHENTGYVTEERVETVSGLPQ